MTIKKNTLFVILRQKLFLEKEMHFYSEIITYGPSINTMDHPDLNGSIVMENLISPQRVNHFL